MAIVQLRHDNEGRRYYRRRLAAGKPPMEALRALKRCLSDIVYRQMLADAKRLETGPGGHAGATLTSSAADPIPAAGPLRLGADHGSYRGAAITPAGALLLDKRRPEPYSR